MPAEGEDDNQQCNCADAGSHQQSPRTALTLRPRADTGNGSSTRGHDTVKPGRARQAGK